MEIIHSLQISGSALCTIIDIDWLQVPVSIIVCSFLCLLFSFSTLILAGAESAIFSLSPGDLEKLNHQSKRAYRALLRLIEHPKMLVATIDLLLTLASTGFIIMLTFISVQVTWPVSNIWWPFLPEIFLVAVVMVLLMHTIPNALSEKFNTTWTIILLPGLSILFRIFYPLSKLMLYSQKKVDETVSNLTDSQVMASASPSADNTEEENKQEVKLLKGIMKFGSTQVKQVMKPRPDVIAVAEDMDFPGMVKVVKDSGYSRMPVFRESLDNVIGTLYTKDLLTYLQPSANPDWKQIIRPAFFVPEGKKISELLIEFQKKMIHQAIVVDEYGSTAGIITLEDILEEIIGEIRDELDDRTDLDYMQIDKNNYVFEGKVLLNDLYRVMNIKNQPFEEVKGDIDSIGGLIMELRGKIPEVNDELAYKNFHFKVLNMDNHRIKRVKVSVERTQEAQEDGL